MGTRFGHPPAGGAPGHGVSFVRRAGRTILRTSFIFVVGVFLAPSIVHAADLGDVHGVVHDAQHRPVLSAKVELKAATSAWSQTAQTDAAGEFSFPGVPLGELCSNRQTQRVCDECAALDRPVWRRSLDSCPVERR